MRLICEISRALNATREERDSGLREGGEREERAMRSLDAC